MYLKSLLFINYWVESFGIVIRHFWRLIMKGWVKSVWKILTWRLCYRYHPESTGLYPRKNCVWALPSQIYSIVIGKTWSIFLATQKDFLYIFIIQYSKIFHNFFWGLILFYLNLLSPKHLLVPLSRKKGKCKRGRKTVDRIKAIYVADKGPGSHEGQNHTNELNIRTNITR